MKNLLLIITIMACALNANAQTYLEHLQTNEAGKGNVTVHQSREIDALINGTKPNTAQTRKAGTTAKKKAPVARRTPLNEDGSTDITSVDMSKKVMRNGYTTNGYRVQVYAGGNSKANKTKAESIGNNIKRLFPDEPVYVHFYSPRWICRMGNYRTLEEAQEVLHKVREAGYKQASLVKGKITVTD